LGATNVDLRGGTIDGSDHGAKRLAYFAARSRSQQCVHNPGGPLQQPINFGRRRRQGKKPQPRARRLEDREIDGGVSTDFVGCSEYEDGHFDAGILEMPRDDVPVAPVVSLAATDHDRAGDSQGLEQFRAAAAGVLHQHNAGQMKLLDRPLIHRTDLLPRQGFHATGHWNLTSQTSRALSCPEIQQNSRPRNLRYSAP
jgi:hypothetical protein